MRTLTLFFVALMLCNTASIVASTRPTGATMVKSKLPTKKVVGVRVSLAKLAREAVAVHFGDSHFQNSEQLIAATPIWDEYKKPAGLFVTLSRGGKTRACWGSVYPTNQDLVTATVETTEQALTKEYRYPRIRRSEWQSLKAQVTVIRSLEPISNLSEQNAMQYGMYVRQGGRGAVLLPGEASDAHYQLVRCKLKAGIPVSQPCQIYRMRADVLK